MLKKKIVLAGVIVVFMLIIFGGCVKNKTRDESIPDGSVKMTPETDLFPPVLHSSDWMDPEPLGGPINTAGAEDSPVISSDGDTLFFFFTPDVKVPPDKQLLDGVTGIWWCSKNDGSWSEPQRLILSYGLALDSPMCVRGDKLWFASFRRGNYGDDGDIWVAEYINGKWSNWENTGEKINKEYNVGELCVSPNEEVMYFHRLEGEGYGGYDIWRSIYGNGTWQEPENLGSVINTGSDESQPFISSDGKELWFTSNSRLGYTGPALFRSLKEDNGSWGEPVEIISNFAGDPSVDDEGNIYFTHHFFDDKMNMIEADIYVAYRK